MTEVAILHSRLQADTKSGNSKMLPVQGKYHSVRMAAFPGMNCSRASQQKQACMYTVRCVQSTRKGHSHCSSLLHPVQWEINLNFTAEALGKSGSLTASNPAFFQKSWITEDSSCTPYIATQKRERFLRN